jgi:hypothetical protein
MPILLIALLIVVSPSVWGQVAVESPATVTLRPRQDLAYAVISLENSSDKVVVINRMLRGSSLDITAKPKEDHQVGRIQVRPCEQFQFVLELERQPDVPNYINTYTLEVTDGDGKPSSTRFHVKVDQLWPWRGHATSLFWDQSAGEAGPKQFVLELDEGYTAEVDPRPTKEIAVLGVADGRRYTVTVTPTVGLEVLFNERAWLRVRGPDGVVYHVATYCFRVEKIHH